MKSVEDIKKYFENHPIYSWVISIILATSILTSWASGCLDLKEKAFPKENKKESIIEKEFDYSKLKPTVEAAPKDIMRDIFYGAEKEALLLKLGYPTKKEEIDSLQILSLEWLTKNINIQTIFYKNKLIFATLEIDTHDKVSFDLYMYEKIYREVKPFGQLLFKEMMHEYYYYYRSSCTTCDNAMKVSVMYYPGNGGRLGSGRYYFQTNYCCNNIKDVLKSKISIISLEPDYDLNLDEIPEEIFWQKIGGPYHYKRDFFYKEDFIKSIKEVVNDIDYIN